MAEEKKKDDKKEEKPKTNSKFYWEEILLLILAVITIFAVIVPRISPRATPSEGQTAAQNGGVDVRGWYNRLVNPTTEVTRDSQGQIINTQVIPSLVNETRFRAIDLFQNIVYAFFFISVFCCLLFGLIIYHNKFRLKSVVDEYKEKTGLKPTPAVTAAIEKATIEAVKNPEPADTNGVRNPRWELVEKYYNSANQSDWRLAIMEADIMLYDLLDKIGFEGDSIGEKLKKANSAQFQNLQVAWKSHLVRNRLAHDGAGFVLTRNIVEETIEGYRRVFEEFYYI